MPSRPARSKHDRLIPSHRADGWEPLEILRGMDAQSTLRSVALTLKVADLYVV